MKRELAIGYDFRFFNRKGELIFDIGLIAADETTFPVKALFDTGFNDWLLINNKSAAYLGWVQEDDRIVNTAAGITLLNVYEGIILIDGEEFIIPVLKGDEIKNILLGVRWLQFKRLIADYSAGVLTLD
jgi:predicted aspartyl protease